MRPAAVLAAMVRVQGLKTANAGLIGFQTNLAKTDAASTAALGGASKYGKYLKGGLVVAAVAAAYALGKGAKAGSEFNAQMSSLQSVTKANEKQLGRLRVQALKFGETTIFSANSAAKAQTELAKGGLTVEQIYKGGLNSALTLAAAGELELEDAATITANAMSLFALKGGEANKVADAMAVAANATTADVYDFGMALKQGGGAARLVGYDLEQTMTILEALAKSGIRNSDAGTSMKAALIQLVKPTKKQAELAAEYNLELIKQNGEMKNAAGISAELKRATADMTATERAKFVATLGGTDGLRTLNALYEAGPATLKKYERSLGQAGYAQQTANEKTDNLKYDLKKLLNVLEVMGIKLETKLEPALRATVQWLTDAGLAIMNFDLSGFIDEVEEAYDAVHNALGIDVGGMDFSFAPEVDEVEEANSWLENATMNTINAIVVGYEWLEDAAVASFHGVVAGIDWIVDAFNAFTGWVGRAWNNVTGFLGELIPLKIAFAAIYIALQPVMVAIRGLGDLIGLTIPYFKFAATVVGVIFVEALKIAWAAIQTFLKFVGNMGSVFADVIGVISNLLRGNWANAWKDAKQLVVDVWHTIIDLIKGAWTQIKTVTGAGIKIVKTVIVSGFETVKDSLSATADFMEGIFSGVWDIITGIFTSGANAVISVLNAVIDAINLIPGIPDIGNIGEVGAKAGGGKTKMTKQEKTRGYATGGKVTKPIAIMGEEAPRHHEWVVATNPAYRQKNIGHWAAAGKDLGVPGFAEGGMFGSESLISLPSASDVVGAAGDVAKTAAEYSTPGLAFKGIQTAAGLVEKGADWLINKLPDGMGIPEPFSGVGPYVVDKAKDFINGWFDENKQKVAAASSGGGSFNYKGPPADMKKLGDNSWVDSHTYAVAEYIVGKFGNSISSDWRSAAENAAANGSPTSSHMRGTAANPGAFDFVPPSTAVQSWVAEHIAGITENDIHDYGSGLHNHIAFFAQGGLISDWDALTGSTWDNNELATLAHLVGMANPGKMAQKAQGESTGNRKAVGNDPGGTEGLGLWQITTNFNDEKIAKYGGRESMFHPYLNALAGNEVLQEQGIGAWYAPFTGPVGQVNSDLSEKMQAIAGGKGGLSDKQEDARQKKAEGKARKAAREAQLKKLEAAVGAQKTDKAKRSKMWQLMKFWGRAGMFEDEERKHILEKVRLAASTASIPGQNKILGNLTKYAGDHGEITGKDPGQYHDLIDAMEKAQDQGDKIRDKTIERHKTKKERLRNEKIASIAARGTMPGLIGRLEAHSKQADRLDEMANQITSLEPEDITDAYVQQEIGAWKGSLGELGSWRNTAVKGQDEASWMMKRLEAEIANITVFKPEPGKKSLNPEWTKIYKNNKWKLKPLREAMASAKEVRDVTLPGELESLSPQTPSGIIDSLPFEPVAGMFGGRIFDTQNTIRELGLKSEEPSVGGLSAAQEAELDLQKEETLNWRKRYLILREQQKVMATYPSVGDIPGFALGGVTPAWVGERGKELIAPPVGSRVVSSREATQAVADGQGGTTVIIENLTIHEDGSATATVGGEDKDVEVRRVTREDVRKATFGHTPGGTTR